MTALVSIRELVKNYQALRPLRINELSVEEGDVVSLLGLDAPAAEMMVGLLTGALLPDSGEVRLFNRSTNDIDDSDAWLAMLDGVGIVTERAVLIDQFTVEQNIAMPFTLDVDPVGESVKSQVAALADEIGLGRETLNVPVGRAGAEARTRVRIARALALGPRLLLAEHPSASLPREAVEAVARDLKRIAAARRLTVLALTADEAFARGLGGRMLRHEPATGALKPPGFWNKLFSSA
jgi:predicted ABC-type transport system involved in lysophospholipase L1 biosynthesis ATPase subunit